MAHLRAVGPSEGPPVPAIDSVLTAAEHGSRVDELKQMRRVIAKALDDERTAPRDLAALSKRQIEISREIDALEHQAAEEAVVDAATEDEAWNPEAV